MKASRLLYPNTPKVPPWGLRENSFSIISTPRSPLTTHEVDYGMHVGSLLNPDMDGLQNEMVYSPWFNKDPVYIPKKQFCQILNIHGNKWIMVSNRFAPHSNAVVVYDSKFVANLYGHEQLEQISRLLNPTDDHIEVTFANVQQEEPHSNNCGHYSIVYTWAICQDIEPEKVSINESDIHNQIEEVFRGSLARQTSLWHKFELRQPPPEPMGEMVIALCAKCKLACEEAPCYRCNKRVHEECKWFDTLNQTENQSIVKSLGCKVCGT